MPAVLLRDRDRRTLDRCGIRLDDPCEFRRLGPHSPIKGLGNSLSFKIWPHVMELVDGLALVQAIIAAIMDANDINTKLPLVG